MRKFLHLLHSYVYQLSTSRKLRKKKMWRVKNKPQNVEG